MLYYETDLLRPHLPPQEKKQNVERGTLRSETEIIRYVGSQWSRHRAADS